MALLGKAAVLVLSEMADPAGHDLWHSREHLPERTGIPGFLRARRCLAADGEEPRYLVLYELRDASVLTSPGYLARLNNPTEWTRKTMSENRSLNRTLCKVAATHGVGIGGVLSAIFVTPPAEREPKLGNVIANVLPDVAGAPGIVAAHLLQRAEGVVRPDTLERQLRTRPDGFVDWVILVEGYDQSGVAAAVKKLASDVAGNGGEVSEPRAPFHLAHVMSSSAMNT